MGSFSWLPHQIQVSFLVIIIFPICGVPVLKFKVCCDYIMQVTRSNVLYNLSLCCLMYCQLIAPISASGVVLDAPEASKLLSAVAIALSNCGRYWEIYCV